MMTGKGCHVRKPVNASLSDLKLRTVAYSQKRVESQQKASSCVFRLFRAVMPFNDGGGHLLDAERRALEGREVFHGGFSGHLVAMKETNENGPGEPGRSEEL